MSKMSRVIAALLFALVLAIAPSAPAHADEAEPADEPLEVVAEDADDPLDANSGGTVNVYRLYNRKTSEHLYTTSLVEYNQLPSNSKGQ